MNLKILITGGSSGIGEALARRISNEEGAQIYITGRSESKLKNISDSINNKGGICYFSVNDVRNSDEARKIVSDAINKMDGIDVLFANAGVGKFKLLEDLSDNDIDIQFSTNVIGVLNYLRPTLQFMKSKNNGQIIVTSSNLGFDTVARGSVYCASKFAVQAIIGSLRKELQGTKIKAATINPGSIDTPWYSDYNQTPKIHRLNVEEVVDAIMLIINQGERSNIDHILLNPTYQKN